jgi:hypothetical protein
VLNPSVHDSNGTLRSENLSSLTEKDPVVLRKRHMVPRWWCAGLKSKLEGSPRKKGSAKNLANETDVLTRIEGAACLNKHISLLTSVWNELVTLVVAGRGQEYKVQISLQHLVRGTSHEIMGQFSFLETYWSSPFQLRFPESAKNSKSLQSFSFNFVQWARVEGGQEPVLNLEFSLKLEDVVLGKFEKFFRTCELSFGEGGIVSLHPDVIKSLGASAQSRKMCHYLQIEIDKNLEQSLLGWVPIHLSAETLHSRFKETKQLASQLYDHGALGWDVLPPQRRIRAPNSPTHPIGPVIYWRLSEHLKTAAQYEQRLSNRLCSVKSGPELFASVHVLRPEPKVQKLFPTLVSPALELYEVESKIEQKVILQNEVQELDSVPAPDTWDRKVLEYYLSLSDKQKEQFRDYKASLSYEEFRRQFSVVVGS